jgi:hypothetical protein
MTCFLLNFFISNDNNERIKKFGSNFKSHYLLKILVFEEILEKQKKIKKRNIDLIILALPLFTLFLLFLVSNNISKV